MQAARLHKHPVETASKTLRVLAVSSIFPNRAKPQFGIFSGHEIEHLSKVATVRVISPVKWFPGLGLVSQAERQLSAIPWKDEYCGVPVSHPRFFRTPGFGRRWHGWFYKKSLENHIIEAIEEFKPDVILAIWANPDGVALQEIGERLRIPVVIKCLGSDIHQLLKEDARGAQVMNALNRCARVVSVSQGLRKTIMSHGIPPGHVDVVYNGVDREVFKPRPRDEARHELQLPLQGKIILCVANLLPIKRHCDLLLAFKLLREEMFARLVLIGDGPLRSKLAQNCQDLGISGDVHFAGSLGHEDVARWMSASDAVCLSSANEGLPNVLNEALASGRPVVATAVGGVPELIHSPQYGRLVAPGDISGFAGALKDVISRNWNPMVLSACRNVVTWDQSAAALLKIIERVHEERQRVRF